MARFARSRRLDLDGQLRPLIEDRKLQHHKAAILLGVSRSWVLRACRRLGLQTQRTGPRSGKEHPGWKGGRVLRKGYVYLYCPEHPFATAKGYVLEHRLVMERELKRYLRREEVVHHRNANRADNRLANLGLFRSNQDHLRHELAGRVPKWTEAGRARIRAGVEHAANLRRGKFGGDRQPR